MYANGGAGNNQQGLVIDTALAGFLQLRYALHIAHPEIS